MSDDTLDKVTEDSMIVDILDDRSGVKIHFNKFKIEDDITVFGNLVHILEGPFEALKQ